MSLNVIPRAFGTCLVDISNACSDFFAKRMNKVENKKVDDSAHLAHASSTLDKSGTIPVDASATFRGVALARERSKEAPEVIKTLDVAFMSCMHR